MLHLLRVGLVVLALLIAAQSAGASNRTEQENKDGVAQAQEAARDQAAGLAVEKVVDTARAAATTMALPANRQAAAERKRRDKSWNGSPRRPCRNGCRASRRGSQGK